MANDRITINGVEREIDSEWITINGVWRKVDKSLVTVNGVWREAYTSYTPPTYNYTALELTGYRYSTAHNGSVYVDWDSHSGIIDYHSASDTFYIPSNVISELQSHGYSRINARITFYSGINGSGYSYSPRSPHCVHGVAGSYAYVDPFTRDSSDYYTVNRSEPFSSWGASSDFVNVEVRPIDGESSIRTIENSEIVRVTVSVWFT